MGELYRKLAEYGKEDFYPYHMPGHKRRNAGEMPRELFDADITEIDGFDNLHQAEGILRDAQERSARLYGAEETFFLVNGSTCGILSAISAAVPQGGHILMTRNCHKSAYHGAYLRGLQVSYLYPEVSETFDFPEAITPEEVARGLEASDDIDAVLIVSPTYEGRIADVKAIAEVVHAKGIPLIVDEAHGAHLGLAGNPVPNSCQSGADLVIHSVHKTLPAMTQTALLHVNGDLVDRDKLRRFLHIYQSSSPSYILMASIDNAVELMQCNGAELYHGFEEQYVRMTERLSVCNCLEIVPFEQGVQDCGKLIISSKKAGLSGRQIYDMLLERYHLQLEMACESYCLAMFTVGDTPEAYERMEQALLELDAELGRKAQTECYSAGALYGKQDAEVRFPLGQAWDMPCEEVPLVCAVGRAVGEFVNLYPPGIPMLVPGEVLQEEHYRTITEMQAKGFGVQGIGQTEDSPVKVIRESSN